MSVTAEVLIVSAFGRGHWLAADLSRAGVSSVLVDVTEHLGRWAPEDWEGPFGFFQADHVLESQVTRLHEEDYLESVPEGFVVWTNKGVLDTSGPIATNLFEKWHVGQDQQEYLRRAPSLGESEKQELKQPLFSKAFKDVWLTHLAHSLAAPFFVDNARALQYADALPVLAPHFVRRPSRRGFEQNLNWTASWGAKVYSKASLKDFSFQNKKALGLEITSDWSGVITAEKMVWCLTSEETEFLSKDIQQSVFAATTLKPEWQWQRYRVQIQGADVHLSLPLHTVCIEDLGLPWTHENLFVIQRSVIADEYDVWLRLPSNQRFHRPYIEKKGERMLRLLQKRLPGCEVRINQWPPEHSYDYEALGPARFNLYPLASWGKAKFKSWTNLIYDGPEKWRTLDWSAQMKAQAAIREQLIQWKESKELEKKRQEQEVQA